MRKAKQERQIRYQCANCKKQNGKLYKDGKYWCNQKCWRTKRDEGTKV